MQTVRCSELERHLELRLEQLLDGVSQPQAYKTVELKLQRPFGRDFDDF